MRRASCFALLAGFLAVGSAAAEEKGTVVDLDGIKSTTPASWQVEPPANKMRFAQFRIKGKDGEDAELVIFKGLGGGVKQNVERWKGQFIAPEGKTIDDVSKVSEITLGGKKATRLDISGTYKFKAAPFDPNSKEERKPGYKMVAIYFDGPEDVYQIKLTGPAKTVDEHLKEFDDWIKAFK
jgi:gluconolactonase